MDNKKNSISIVMTTFNGAKYIAEQMESIKNQSLAVDEVLIFDDKSDDNRTVEIVNSFICTNGLSNWKLIVNEKNLGWKKNFIQAMKAAEGDLIFLADQDDIWYPEKIKYMTEAMINHAEINVLCCNYEILNQSEKRIRSNSAQNMYNDGSIRKIEITPKFHLVGRPGCTYCVRRDFVEDIIPLWIEDYAHDQLVWIAGVLSESLYCLEEPLISFRRHEGNASGRGTNLDAKSRIFKMTLDVEIINKCIDKFEINHGKTSAVVDRYMTWYQIRKNFLEKKNIEKFFRLLPYRDFYSSNYSLIADLLAK